MCITDLKIWELEGKNGGSNRPESGVGDGSDGN